MNLRIDKVTIVAFCIGFFLIVVGVDFIGWVIMITAFLKPLVWDFLFSNMDPTANNEDKFDFGGREQAQRRYTTLKQGPGVSADPPSAGAATNAPPPPPPQPSAPPPAPPPPASAAVPSHQTELFKEAPEAPLSGTAAEPAEDAGVSISGNIILKGSADTLKDHLRKIGWAVNDGMTVGDASELCAAIDELEPGDEAEASFEVIHRGTSGTIDLSLLKLTDSELVLGVSAFESLEAEVAKLKRADATG